MTALAYIWTPEEIIVAADSKVGSSDKSLDIPPVCKIYQADKNTFFALTGLIMEDDKEVEYDAVMLAHRACVVTGTLKDKIDAFEQIIRDPLTKAVEFGQKNNSAHFNENRNAMNLGILIFGIESGKLVMSRRKYDVKKRSKEFIIKPAGGSDVTEASQNFDAWLSIDVSLEKCRKFYSNSIDAIKKDTIAAARKFIEQAISDNPDNIGPPIDILRVTKNGAEWAQRKDGCPEIRNR